MVTLAIYQLGKGGAPPRAVRVAGMQKDVLDTSPSRKTRSQLKQKRYLFHQRKAIRKWHIIGKNRSKMVMCWMCTSRGLIVIVYSREQDAVYNFVIDLVKMIMHS